MNSSRSRTKHTMNKDDYMKRFDGRRRRSRSRRRRKGSSSSSGSSRSRSGGRSRRRRRRTYSSRSKSSSPKLVQPRIETINLDDDNHQKPPWARMNFTHCPPPNFQNLPPGYPPQNQQMPGQRFPAPASGSFPPNTMNQGQYSSMQNIGQPPIHEVGYPGYQNNSSFPPTFTDPAYQSFDAPPPPQATSTAPWQTQTQPVFNQPPQTNYPVPHWLPPEKRTPENTSNLIYPKTQKTTEVEQEALNQKKSLLKQREEYLKKNNSLLRELSRLKEQRQELLQESSDDSERFLKENTKLQNEIGQRLKAIENVVDMLTSLIGDSFELSKIDKMPPSTPPLNDKMKKIPESKVDKPDEEVRMPLPERRHEQVEDIIELDSPSRNANPSTTYYSPNLVHYDPELHWCSLCNVFPKTVVAYLNHLHTPEHRGQIVRLKLDESPWHSDIPQETLPPFNKDAPSKRVPIRGVQFLVPSTGWYCRLCKVWLGDLHCCSNHLKGTKHTSNYAEYVSQNPHWEVDWLADRTRSYERSSEQLSRMTDATQPGVSMPPQSTQLQSTTDYEQTKINVLSSTLLAVLAQQNKGKTRMKDSSSSSSSSSDESTKKKDKRKRRKKKKKRKESHSKSVSPVRHAKSPEDDALISEWMAPKDEIMPKFRDVMPDKSDSVLPRHKFVSSDKPKELKEYRDMRMDREDSREKILQRNFRNINARNMPEARERDFRDDRGRRNVKEHRRGNSREHGKFDRESPRESKRRDDFGLRGDEKRKPDLSKYVPEPKRETKPPEKPKGNLWFPSNKEEEDTETSFEKQSAESAAKKKAEARKPTQFTLPKTKLPFIGRMPILKKKPAETKNDDKMEDITKPIHKEETLPTKENIWPNIPNITEDEDSAISATVLSASEIPSLPKSTLIISKRPRLGEADDSGTLTKAGQAEAKKKTKATEDNLAEQDMDIECDEQEPIIWEGSETVTESVPEAKEELHKDFKDALDLLFPEEGKEAPKKATDEKPDESEAYNMGAGQMWIPTSVPPPGVNSSSYYPPNYAGQSAAYYGPGYDASYPGGYYAPGGYAPGVPPSVPVCVPPTNIAPPVSISAHGVLPSGVPHPGVMPPTDANGVPLIAPPPPGMDEDDEEETAPKKRKNPLSQRMRRHLRKKKAEAESESESKTEASVVLDEGKKKYEGMEMSDLAMLGIDEDDSTAQQF